jgi:hypothetical protein
MRPYPLLLVVVAACGSAPAEAPPPADPVSQAVTAAPSASSTPDLPSPAATAAASAAPAEDRAAAKRAKLKQKLAGQVPLFGFTDPKPNSKGMCWEMFGTASDLAEVEKNRVAATALVQKKFKLQGAKMTKACPTAGTVAGFCVSAFELGVHFDQKVFTADQAQAKCNGDQMGVWFDAMP